jgi:hypothetical protein
MARFEDPTNGEINNRDSIRDQKMRQQPVGRKQQPPKDGGGGKILLVIVAFACAAFAYGSYKETCGNAPVLQCAGHFINEMTNSK